MSTKYLPVFVLSAFSFLFSAVLLDAAYSLTILGDFSKEQSESLCSQLSSRGYPSYMVYGDNPEVRIGPYESKQKALEVIDTLEQEEKIITKLIEEDFDNYKIGVEEDTQDKESIGREVSEEMKDLYTDERAKKIVSLALDLFGQPYKYGGESIGKGIDCSFFVQTIFKELGIVLPRTAREQIKEGVKISKNNLKVGDLLFFEKTLYSKKKNDKGKQISYTRINHVGIYIGNGEFIHATINVKRVTISRLNEPYFKKHYAGARRFLND